jgi:hypothetical protein
MVRQATVRLVAEILFDEPTSRRDPEQQAQDGSG